MTFYITASNGWRFPLQWYLTVVEIIHFPSEKLCWASFRMLICHTCVFSGKVSVQICSSGVLSLKSSVNIWVQIFDQIHALQVFSPSLSCLFILLIVSFKVKNKSFKFDSVWFVSVFFFNGLCCWCCYLKIHHPRCSIFLFFSKLYSFMFRSLTDLS